MPYYDRIAKQWHAATGFRGGALKKFVLNDLLTEAIGGIEERDILELGAGNGYFLPLVLQRYSGQSPTRIVITDQSARQLEFAQKHCRVEIAEYLQLDVRRGFPFSNADFDLVLATMVFNEVSKRGVMSAFAECHRVLRDGGQFLMTVLHPDFAASLAGRGELRRGKNGQLTMPGSGGMRLPIRKAPASFYEETLTEAGFDFTARDVNPTSEVLNAKPALRKAKDIPLALVFDCRAIAVSR